MEKDRNASNDFVGNPKEKSLLGRTMNTGENNIKMYIKETERYGVD
jgi:hypothetical protein